jgi:uncharacterized membrane protein YgcG
MKTLTKFRTFILIAGLGLGFFSLNAKADVCYWDGNLAYRGVILETYPESALVHWTFINGGPVNGSETTVPFSELTNCGGLYIQWFPYPRHYWYPGYYESYRLRYYGPGCYFGWEHDPHYLPRHPPIYERDGRVTQEHWQQARQSEAAHRQQYSTSHGYSGGGVSRGGGFSGHGGGFGGHGGGGHR